ncbi:MAG: sensor domain-containing diguanylate cyclase [Ruminococcus sp.]|nr:sensor domain-containing diguanylate cyclase [Ruminococcus sp.]
MDYQDIVESIDGMATLYSFDILPDGSYSEIRLMAVNKNNDYMLHFSPDSPEFYPGIPYRKYWMDLNFEEYIYKSASKREPLYSYINAHGGWLKGIYIPISIPEAVSDDSGKKTYFCLYTFTYEKEVDAESFSQHSTEVSNAVVNISIKLHESQDFAKGMASAVSDIKAFCGAKRCAVYTVDTETQKCGYIDENGARDDDLDRFAAQMGRTPYETALMWEKDLALSDCFLLKDLELIKERDPEWYHSLTINGVSNMILYAIRHNQTLVGFIWAADFDTTKMSVIKETLEMTSFLIAAVIANHQLVSRLEKKSTIDELTQVNNRNAMNDRVDRLRSGDDAAPEVMGVVFADLNGLKNVNDTKGHKAGDKLLYRAAALLKIAFGDHEIYRAGGDEFVVLCPDITEEQFMQQAAQLRTLADSTSDVRFAVGCVYCTGSYDIIHAMQEADERMYRDKEEYYTMHPERDHRKRS